MSTTTLKLPFKRFVAQVSSAPARSKSSYLALMAENLEALKKCPWREAAVVPVSLTGHDFTASTQFSDAYDAFKLTGNYETANMTEIAYAGMAAYRFKIPASAMTGSVPVASVSLPVSRDRFLKDGLHVATAFSASAEPSADWETIRGSGALAASSVLAQSAATLMDGSADATTVTLDLSGVSSGNPAAYLWVYVTLEDYTDRWTMYNAKEKRLYAVEGSAMLAGGSAEFTFDGAVTADADEGLVEIPITRDTVVSSNFSACSLMYGVAVLANGDSFSDLARADSNGERRYALTDLQKAMYNPNAFRENPQKYVVGLRQLYAKFNSGRLEMAQLPSGTDGTARVGAAFSCRPDKWTIKDDDGNDIEVAGWSISASAIAVPFSVPSGATVKRLRAAWGDVADGNGTGAFANGGKYTFWLKRGTQADASMDALMKKPEIYIGSAREVDGWENIGSSSGNEFEATLATPLAGGNATLLVTAYADQSAVIDFLFGAGVPKGVSLSFRAEPSGVDGDAGATAGTAYLEAGNMTPNISLFGTMADIGSLIGEYILRFTAQEAGSTVSMMAVGNAPSITLVTSVDGGETWQPFVVGSTTITLANVGDSVLFMAGLGGNERLAEVPNPNAAYNYFVMTGKVSASGTVNSLLSLYPEPKEVRVYGLAHLFSGCTSLVNAPALPATTLAEDCYLGMFRNCTSLVNAPALPATTLAEDCYALMFYGCTSLVNAPALPATTLAESCYRKMFEGCTSLAAMTTAQTSFTGCGFWLYGVAASGTFKCPSALGTNESITRGDSACPTGWTVVNT